MICITTKLPQLYDQAIAEEEEGSYEATNEEKNKQPITPLLPTLNYLSTK